MRVTFLSLLRNPVHLLAFGFGAGLAPKAPGTWGTLVALPLVYAVHAVTTDLIAYLAVVTLMAVLGIWLCGKTSSDLGVHDHGGIVWDEIVGMLCVLVALPLQWSVLLTGFILFRLFDIFKPWPIGWLDKSLQGGVGIMLDDVLAGVFCCALLHLSIYLNFLPV